MTWGQQDSLLGIGVSPVGNRTTIQTTSTVHVRAKTLVTTFKRPRFVE